MVIQRFILTGLVLMTLSGCSQTLWVDRDFSSVTSRVDTLTVLFPQIQFSQRNGKTSTTKTGYSIYVSKTVQEAITQIINEGEYVSATAVPVYDTLQVGLWLQTLPSRSIPFYHPIRDSIRTTQDNKRLLSFTPALQSFVSKLHSRLFLCVAGSAFGTSEQTKQFDDEQRRAFKLFYDEPFDYGYQWSGLEIEIALVNATTHEVLWYNYNKRQESQYDPLNEKRVKDLCMQLLEAR